MKGARRLRPILEALLVAVAYYAAARLGLLLAFGKSNATPVWPPSGIALGLVLLRGRPALAGVFVGALVANVQVFQQNQAASLTTVIIVSALISAGNALEAQAGAWLLRRLVGPAGPFERAQDVFKFVGVAFVMCLVSAAVGPAAVVGSGVVPRALYPTVWLTWWLGDTAGVLVFAPLLLAGSATRRTRWTIGKIVEAVFLVILLLIFSRVVFGGWPLESDVHYPWKFLLMPVLGWIALRFSRLEASLAVMLVSAMAVGAATGSGLPGGGDVLGTLLLLQAFIGVLAVTTLAIGAMVTEVERARRELLIRVSQQAAVASLGRAALADGGLDAFLRDAAAQVARTLRVEMCGILELLPGGDELRPRTAMGWTHETEGEDLRLDDPDVPARLGAVSGMTAVIDGEESRPFGLLLIGAKDPRAFTDDDVNFAQAVAHLIAATIRRKRIEQELARSNSELQQFAYAASHDLQEPLRTIASYTQLLQRRYWERLDSDADDFIRFAVSAATRMRSLIQALLEYSRIGGSARSHRPLSTERVLAQAMSNLAARIAETEAAVTHDPLPPILGDEPLLVQLFQNLLGNAIKFSGDRRPVIHVSTKRSGGEVTFAMEDNGIGIEPQHADEIFLMFRRLHAADEYPGTGVGLAICRKIVERHGGRIWVESTPGSGSTFRFTLPAAERAGVAVVEESARGSAS